MEVKKREGESAGSLIYRFNKKTRQSGLLKEARKRRFKKRPTSKIKRRQSAIHKATKKKAFEKARKLGTK